jgi:hypothetical protein
MAERRDAFLRVPGDAEAFPSAAARRTGVRITEAVTYFKAV